TDPWTSLDTTKWRIQTDKPGDSVSVSGGVVTVAPAPNTPDAYASLDSLGQFSLLGSSVTIKVPQVISTSGNVGCRFTIYGFGDEWDEGIGFQVCDGNISATKTIAQQQTTTGTVTYSSTAHLWWRFRESAGTLFWETSPDRSSWTTMSTTPTSGLRFNLAS